LILYFKFFGSCAWLHIPKEKTNKLKPINWHYILLGYIKTSKLYDLYDPSTNKVIKQRDVEFDEVLSMVLHQDYIPRLT
jgi:hypothetical protein